ncbi:MAG: ATPase [Bacteroidales bacterium]|jgi:N-acetylglucosamine kinase-like BadF-type ATPase|nr:ATPase [Bacteroidales bacterium]
MILIADSGSTKTEWRIVNASREAASFNTQGINPFFLNEDQICLLLKNELGALEGEYFEAVYYYGTGCNSETRNATVSGALRRFMSAGKIIIGSDLLGAARSLCQDKPGIACIMGTGSNSCYYDGRNIAANVSPLGYILGDEGGAAVLGRKLVAAVLKKQVPAELSVKFFDTYNLTAAEILENVYMKPFPNRFLGQFSKFMSANIDFAEIRAIVSSSFDEFIVRNVLQYPESESLPVSFTGSIAIHFRTFLEDTLRRHGLSPGVFSRAPMDDLVKYHEKVLKQLPND